MLISKKTTGSIDFFFRQKKRIEWLDNKKK